MKSTMYMHNMKTLSQGMEQLRNEGFTAEFSINDDGLLEAPDSRRSYEPSDVTIETFRRFEGKSNPSDMSILYAIKTEDNIKGMLIDSYGAENAGKVAQFIKRTEKED